MGFFEAILGFLKYIWNSFVVLFFSSGNWFFVIVDIAIVSFIVYKIIIGFFGGNVNQCCIYINIRKKFGQVIKTDSLI